MIRFDASRRPRRRTDLRPRVDCLEGRVCLSTVGVHPPTLSRAAMHVQNLAHRHALHARMAAGPEIDSGTVPLTTSTATTTTKTSSGGNGYEYTRLGNPNDVGNLQGQGGLALAGGGTSIDAAFQWMGNRMGGEGDFLVIRCTHYTGYNSYISSLGNFNSVATLDIPNRAAASDPVVKQIIENAEAVFIGGGNQADYINHWLGTPVQQALQEDAARGVPIGGTSAGTDVLGQFIFSAEHNTIDSTQALSDPYDNRLTLAQDFFSTAASSVLANTIVDTHFVRRDRMGRMLTFLARINADGLSPNQMARGIGINEQTALLITPQGQATVIANDGAPDPNVYFLQTPGLAQTVKKNTPLTYRSIAVIRVPVGGSFNLKNWNPGQPTYLVSADAGVLSSTQGNGAIY